MERERILAELTRGFITKASSYGFTMDEIAAYLQETAKAAGITRRNTGETVCFQRKLFTYKKSAREKA